MTATITLQGTSETERTGRNWPKIAGLTYVGAWVVGLTFFGVGPAADASDTEIARYFADHSGDERDAVAAHPRRRRPRSARCPGRGAACGTFHPPGPRCWLDRRRTVVGAVRARRVSQHGVDRLDHRDIGAHHRPHRRLQDARLRHHDRGKHQRVPFERDDRPQDGDRRQGRRARVDRVRHRLRHRHHALLVSADVSLVLLLVWVGYAGVAAGRQAR